MIGTILVTGATKGIGLAVSQRLKDQGHQVIPGPIETKLFREKHPVGSDAEKVALARIPLGRIGQPSDIAAVVAFLLSDDAGFITGQTIAIDGGSSL